MTNRVWHETLYDAYGQSFSIDRVEFESKTDHQHSMIFHNARFGRVMVLDGVVQTTERDEFIYHEMLTHQPLLAHGNVGRVLVIGGGDGGIARELCRHASVESIHQVEIDRAVVDMAREYFPNHSAGAFDDPRFNLIISDGNQFVADTELRFDLIIVDSTDPIGPGSSLFTQTFYHNCKRCLAAGGLLVTQNGVPFFQVDECLGSARAFAEIFADWAFYSAAVPTYVGGIMAFGWASDDAGLRHVSAEQLQQRFVASGITTRYYNPQIHRAAFALPQYLQSQLNEIGAR